MAVKNSWMPRPVTTRTGKTVLAHVHKASFKGVHNATKSKVFIVLYHRRFKLGEHTGLSLHEIVDNTGANYHYLTGRLLKWIQWGYVKRKPGQAEGRPVFLYTIAKRGKHFIEHRLPKDKLQQYTAEIREHRKTN